MDHQVCDVSERIFNLLAFLFMLLIAVQPELTFRLLSYGRTDVSYWKLRGVQCIAGFSAISIAVWFITSLARTR